MERIRSTLKSYFETGDYPTEPQFADLIDSFLNIEEDEAVTGITDNGDGTYTFQLLSGGSETLDVKSLPDSIPIATIAGLQVALDGLQQAINTKTNIESKGTGDVKTGRNVWDDGVHTYSVHSANINKPSGLTYGTSIVWGRGTGGSAELMIGWTSGDQNQIYFRSLRDTTDDWWPWKKIWHSGNLDLSNHSADILIAKNNAWLTLDSSSTGADGEEQAAGLSIGESGYKGSAAIHMTYTGNGKGYIGMGSVSGTTSIPANAALEFQYQNTYTIFRGQARFQNASSYLLRQGVSNSGYQVGLYSQASSTAYASPIYTLGTAYLPNDTTLGNMYGIGFANSAASFLNSTDLGTNPAGWGLYIAADGNARIFLNGSNGTGYFKDVVYASNFILNSDIRLKEEVEDVKIGNLPVRWRTFKMKNDENSHQRYGVIAQELEELCPDFVRTDEEGNKSVAYIDLLVAKNAELEARLEKMEKIIEKLI